MGSFKLKILWTSVASHWKISLSFKLRQWTRQETEKEYSEKSEEMRKRNKGMRRENSHAGRKGFSGQYLTFTAG
jgi:hypothetical protein